MRLVVPLVVFAVLAFGHTDASAQVTCFGKGPVLTCFNSSSGPAYQVNCFGQKDYLSCQSQNGSFSASTKNAGANMLNAPSLQSGGTTDPLLTPQTQLVRPCVVPLTCLSGTADAASALSGSPSVSRTSPGGTTSADSAVAPP